MGEFVVEIVKEATRDLEAAVGRLVGQLSSSARPPSFWELSELVDSSTTSLLLARSSTGDLVGMTTLVVFRIPTGVRAWIEDVVVDEAWRGRGIGSALVREAIEEARRRGAKTVDLTSRPSRLAANRMYQNLGFEIRDTNVYRLRLE
jgi:ribosomal protein S18 acetylase RimI-like enzyme